MQFYHCQQFEKYTEHTIVDPQDLTVELKKIRNSGIAYDNEEHELGVRCVAAPIFNQAGDAIAALSISGPTVRMVNKKLILFREMVKNSASEISSIMGYFSK